MLIIFSRQRSEENNSVDIQQLAEHFRSAAVSIPFIYDLPPTGKTVTSLRKKTSDTEKPVLFFSSLPVRAAGALLTTLKISVDFCFDVSGKTTAAVITEVEAALRAERKNIPLENNSSVENLTEPISERWYPVVCRSECSGCLECVNFCLFGVYAIGGDNLPFVDLPDNCRNGCPACSRICPQGVIMFPLHSDDSISGRSPKQKAEVSGGLDKLTDLIDEMA